jgi:uncharacterized protein (TIGR02391 family)
MEKKEVITFLNESLKEISRLEKLSPGNQGVIMWRNSIEDVLKKFCGQDSDEYTHFYKTRMKWPRKSTGEQRRRQYLRQLRMRRIVIRSIINKIELGIATKPSAIVTPKEVTELTAYLFDKMQFHPKVIEASRSCFQSGLYREAILNSFISLIDYVKGKTGSEDEGKSLMAHVFDEKNPLIKLNRLENQPEKDEQEGFKFLFMGATVGIRNPKAHTLIPQSDPLKTLEYLAFASLLMRRIDEGAATKIRRPKEYWNQEEFLVDAEKRCGRERVNVIKKLIDFTTKNSEGGIRWGQGRKYGTFAFRKLIRGMPVSVFLVYSDGTFFLNFGPLKNSGVNKNILESFRTNLNRIPNVKLNNILVTEDNKYGSLGLRTLENTQNFEIFESTVLSLCQQIDSSLKE